MTVLDELKGLAIVLIVLYHAGGVLVWNNYLHGDIGVDIFVILSGLGLALSPNYRGARAFLARRVLRVMPTYWITLTLYAVGGALVLQQPDSTFDLVLHYLGIHAWCGDAHIFRINDSFWFITLILTLYVLFCVTRPLLERPAHLLLAGAGVSTAAAFGAFFWNQPALFGQLTLRIPGFFVGMLLGLALRTGRLVVPAGAALATAGFVLIYVPYTRGIVFHPPAAGLAVMGVYALAVRPRLPVRIGPPLGRGLKFLGDHSLEIFLIHQPLLREYNRYALNRWFHLADPGPGALILGMAAGLVVTLAASVMLRRWLQKVPFLAKG
ncbi:MAG TPA: acyltransferase [Opitutaceae bacterium]|nr:acyltransferase [Opitutaceae bacterium]